VVIGEQGPERAHSAPVVPLVLDIGERIDALSIGRGLEDDVARAVEGRRQGVVEEGFAVHAVASAQVLVALDDRRGGTDAQAATGAGHWYPVLLFLAASRLNWAHCGPFIMGMRRSACWAPACVSYVMVVLPLFPCFVVMRTTPLAPRAP